MTRIPSDSQVSEPFHLYAGYGYGPAREGYASGEFRGHFASPDAAQDAFNRYGLGDKDWAHVLGPDRRVVAEFWCGTYDDSGRSVGWQGPRGHAAPDDPGAG